MLVAAFETVNFKRQKETYLLWHSIVRILQHYFLQFGSTPFGTKPVIMKRLSYNHHPTSGVFNSVFSTKRLLSFAAHSFWAADSTYKMLWQGYPLNLVGAYDAAGKFHTICMSLSSNETADDWSFIFTAIAVAAKRFKKIDVKPTHIMTDAAMAIKKGFLSSFPHVEGSDYDLMCGFHMKKSLNSAPYRDKENKIRIKNDVNIMEQCQSKQIFEHVLTLFISKWQTSEPDFVQYFKKEWVNKNPNWFACANLKAPNTNNATEGTNLTLKRDHTLRERQPMTQFSETFIQMIRYKSEMYARETEPKVFNTSPIIKKEDWTNGAIFASDPNIGAKVIPVNGNLLYIISQKEFDDPKIKKTECENDVQEFFGKMLLVDNFDDYVQNMHQRVYELNFADEWRESTCTCPYYMKKLICKHIIGTAFYSKEAVCPADCNPNVLNKKKSRGRPAKAKSALIVQE